LNQEKADREKDENKRSNRIVFGWGKTHLKETIAEIQNAGAFRSEGECAQSTKREGKRDAFLHLIEKAESPGVLLKIIARAGIEKRM